MEPFTCPKCGNKIKVGTGKPQYYLKCKNPHCDYETQSVSAPNDKIDTIFEDEVERKYHYPNDGSKFKEYS